MSPAARASGAELDDLGHGRKADERVQDAAGGVRLAEVETEDRCDEVELRERNEAQLRPPTTRSSVATMVSAFMKSTSSVAALAGPDRPS